MLFPAIALGSLLFSGGAAPEPTPPASSPETVHVTFHVRAGREKDLERVLERHWPTLRRLGLALETPHLVLRAPDDAPDKTKLIEILRWRDHDAPDNVPPEVQRIWDEMKPLVESRGGRPAIDIEEVSIVSGPGV